MLSYVYWIQYENLLCHFIWQLLVAFLHRLRLLCNTYSFHMTFCTWTTRPMQQMCVHRVICGMFCTLYLSTYAGYRHATYRQSALLVHELLCCKFYIALLHYCAESANELILFLRYYVKHFSQLHESTSIIRYFPVDWIYFVLVLCKCTYYSVKPYTITTKCQSVYAS